MSSIRAAMALLAATTLAAPAQATTVSSASASFSNLTFRLVDLDLNDGIAPGLTVRGDATATIESKDLTAGTQSQVSKLTVSSVQPFANQSADLNFGTVAFGSDSVSVNSTSTVAGLFSGATLAVGESPGMRTAINELTSSTSTALVLSTHIMFNGVPSTGVTLTLSPNTQLVVEGLASSSISLSNSGIAALEPLLRDQTPGFPTPGYYTNGGLFNGNSTATVKMEGALARTTAEQDIDYFPIPRFTLADNLYLAYGATPVPDTVKSQSQAFSLDFSNVTGQAMEVTLMLSASAVIRDRALLNYVDQTTPFPVPTPTIPEPGTYALMGLGLLGLAWARKRQQA